MVNYQICYSVRSRNSERYNTRNFEYKLTFGRVVEMASLIKQVNNEAESIRTNRQRMHSVKTIAQIENRHFPNRHRLSQTLELQRKTCSRYARFHDPGQRKAYNVICFACNRRKQLRICSSVN